MAKCIWLSWNLRLLANPNSIFLILKGNSGKCFKKSFVKRFKLAKIDLIMALLIFIIKLNWWEKFFNETGAYIILIGTKNRNCFIDLTRYHFKVYRRLPKNVIKRYAFLFQFISMKHSNQKKKQTPEYSQNFPHLRATNLPDLRIRCNLLPLSISYWSSIAIRLPLPLPFVFGSSRISGHFSFIESAFFALLNCTRAIITQYIIYIFPTNYYHLSTLYLLLATTQRVFYSLDIILSVLLSSHSAAYK